MKFFTQEHNECILDFINRLVGRRLEKGETSDQVAKTVRYRLVNGDRGGLFDTGL